MVHIVCDKKRDRVNVKPSNIDCEVEQRLSNSHIQRQPLLFSLPALKHSAKNKPNTHNKVFFVPILDRYFAVCLADRTGRYVVL